MVQKQMKKISPPPTACNKLQNKQWSVLLFDVGYKSEIVLEFSKVRCCVPISGILGRTQNVPFERLSPSDFAGGVPKTSVLAQLWDEFHVTPGAGSIQLIKSDGSSCNTLHKICNLNISRSCSTGRYCTSVNICHVFSVPCLRSPHASVLFRANYCSLLQEK